MRRASPPGRATSRTDALSLGILCQARGRGHPYIHLCWRQPQGCRIGAREGMRSFSTCDRRNCVARSPNSSNKDGRGPPHPGVAPRATLWSLRSPSAAQARPALGRDVTNDGRRFRGSPYRGRRLVVQPEALLPSVRLDATEPHVGRVLVEGRRVPRLLFDRPTQVAISSCSGCYGAAARG